MQSILEKGKIVTLRLGSFPKTVSLLLPANLGEWHFLVPSTLLSSNLYVGFLSLCPGLTSSWIFLRNRISSSRDSTFLSRSKRARVASSASWSREEAKGRSDPRLLFLITLALSDPPIWSWGSSILFGRVELGDHGRGRLCGTVGHRVYNHNRSSQGS